MIVKNNYFVLEDNAIIKNETSLFAENLLKKGNK
jgi:hypothetical protein